MIAALGLVGGALAAEPAADGGLPVRWSWVGTLAATSRNLSLGGAVRVGRPTGPFASASLTTDWPFSALVAGFLLDDATSPRVAASQVVGWSFPWPIPAAGPVARAWAPDLTLGVGAWELVEVDSLAQAFRTQDYGAYAGLNTGVQLGLVWPTVSLGFGFRPFGTGTWWHGGEAYSSAFQFTNAVLDVDLTVDLGRLFPPKTAR